MGLRKTRRSRLSKTIQSLSASPKGSGAGAALDGAIRTVGVDVQRARRPFHDFARDDHLFNAFKARQIEHGLEQDALQDRAQAARAGLALDCLAGDGAKRFVREGQLDVLHLEQALVLLDQRVLRIGQDLLQRGLVQIFQRRHDRQTANKFRDQTVLQKILRLDMAEDFAGTPILRRQHLGGEADRGGTAARRDDLLEAGERTTADEQDVGGVDLQELLLRMLAAALRRDRSHRAFHYLQQRLLHTLARDVAGDRGVVGFAADLVDLVDIDDAALRALDIVVGRLQQLQDDVLDSLADIAGFGQRRRVRHGERHVENPRQRLREQRLARAGRTDQKNVRLRKLDVVVLGLVIEPLVVILDRAGAHLLGVALADHIVVEDLADFLRRRDAVARLHQRGLVLLADDIHAELNAFVADEDRRSCDQLADLVLGLSAEREIQLVLGVARADLTHSCLRPPFDLVRSIAPFREGPSWNLDRANSVPKKTLALFTVQITLDFELPRFLTDQFVANHADTRLSRIR